ncbi:chromosomal replication initiator protein DnaA [Treponema sp.]
MADWNYEIFWKETMDQIRNELEEQEFAMWFNLEYLSSTETEIIITVPSSFYRDQVKQRYERYIENKLHELTGKNIQLSMEIRARTSNTESRTPTASKASIEKKQAGDATIYKAAEPKKIKNAHGQLNKDYTFNNYIIGDNNSFAANASIAIAKNPGTAYNPFFIYGGVGLGKTHLMQSIGNSIYSDTDNKIIYITAENFINEFIQSIKEGKQAAFKNKYRFVDVLLVDDIHFLEKKKETQEELFHTFNALYDANKQMVFTCDRPVSELKNLTDRLRSRFERGLTVDLQPPSYETRFAILRKKADARRIMIPDAVIELVARNVTTNVRDLEAALTKLSAYAELVGKDITVEIAQQQLKDFFASPKQANMSIEVIQRVTADYFSLSFNDLKGKKRTKNIVFPRQLAMFIARDITEFSTTELGVEFGGRDHTTVMHACQKIEERIRSDPTLDSTINTLKRTIKEYSAKTE